MEIAAGVGVAGGLEDDRSEPSCRTVNKSLSRGIDASADRHTVRSCCSGKTTQDPAFAAKLTIRSTGSVRLAFRAGVTQSKVSVAIILRLVTDQAKHASHDISHDHLSRLRGDQPSPDALDPFDQFVRICRSAERHHAQEQVCCCGCA